MKLSLWLLLGAVPSLAVAGMPVITVRHDDTRISHSCVVRIPPRLVIADTNDNGVIQIVADNVVVRFAPRSGLRGAASETPGDALSGIGIRIEGHRGVRIENAQVHGFKCGLVATRVDGLRVDGGNFSDNYHQNLRSTPAAEDEADWLYPHHNDQTKWRNEYGGAVCIEDSRDVTVRRIRVRRGQNGILLDRVTDSRIYDNDCSFLSGWGLALWRSSRNTITRNAFDFCVRGYVDGVYNRGQDSAGILCFEQSSDNVFAENSATHCGDGFFGFAGRQAIGELWIDRERARLRKETGRQDVDALIKAPPALVKKMTPLGCNNNVLLDNDFSYAAAHGIEITFSHGNQIVGNRLVENAICGIWGGYSSDTLIADNQIVGNGGMAYGLQRGGINMEHASDNHILDNLFRNNKCGIYLWWNTNSALAKDPGVIGKDHGVQGNVIAGNTFVINRDQPFHDLRSGQKLIVLQLSEQGKGHVRDNRFVDNRLRVDPTIGQVYAVQPGCEPITRGPAPSFKMPHPVVLGRTHPVGARARLRGRANIIMDEWGPWDHASPLVRPRRGAPGEALFDLLGFRTPPRCRVLAGAVTPRLQPPKGGQPMQLRLVAGRGVTPYQVVIRAPGFRRELKGTIVATQWRATFFPWKVDPRKDLAAWRALAKGPHALSATVAALNFPYGYGGPRDMHLSPEITRHGPGPDHFGMIAHTRLYLPAGKWRFETLSDDGVRVTVNGKVVVENWTWHGPTRNAGTYVQTTPGDVSVTVEHFEIDGYSVLRLNITPNSKGVSQ